MLSFNLGGGFICISIQNRIKSLYPFFDLIRNNIFAIRNGSSLQNLLLPVLNQEIGQNLIFILYIFSNSSREKNSPFS